jgi:predicted nuclease of predicted toxin-antitoxin system
MINIPVEMVNWLINEGHDVLQAGEIGAGVTDIHWLELAELSQCWSLTSDKDFGELIYRNKLNSHGIILLRLFEIPITSRLARLQEVWSIIESNTSGSFIVVTPHRVRVRSIT